MWPFDKIEKRSADTSSYTDQLVDAAVSEARGETLDASTLAVVEACMGLWERSLASATVEPTNNRLVGLSPSLLALVGRSLAVKGNLVCRIVVEGATVKLLPAADYDIDGQTDPATWVYRLNLPGPSSTETVMVPADGVVHFMTGAMASAPWRGTAPLRSAKATASLASKIETSLGREADIYTLRLAGVDRKGTFETWKQTVETIRRRKGGVVFTGGVLGQTESSRVPEPAKMGPAPNDTFADALRSQIARDILGAFGIPPALFEARGDGSGQRESWRRYWLGTVAPLARMIEAECREKLDPGATVTLDALRAADEDGRSRAVARRAAAFKTLKDAGIDTAEARRLAGLE